MSGFCQNVARIPLQFAFLLILTQFALKRPNGDAQAIRGVALGVVAVQGLNIVRLISLFYLGQWDLRIFEWAHLYVWQALIMLDVLIVWLLWVRMLPALASVPEPARA